jgi:predicted double-glycine peptidase
MGPDGPHACDPLLCGPSFCKRWRYVLLMALLIGVVLPARNVSAQTHSPVRTLLEQRQRHVVLQQFDLSCGAAALATILKYEHGEALNERQVALGLIRRDIYIANLNNLRIRQGFSLLDMKRYVERLGYEGAALGRMSFEELVARAPAIVPISLAGYSHFVVFRGTMGSSVLIADPAFGNRTLGVERFIAAWIDYENLGHVAFVVRRRDGLMPPNRLGVSAADFAILLPDAQTKGPRE